MRHDNLIRLLCSCIISAGMVVSSYFISTSLVLPSMPSSIQIEGNLDTDNNKEFLSIYQASSFLSMDVDSLQRLIDSGELSSTYVILNGEYLFSRSLLSDYLNQQISRK